MTFLLLLFNKRNDSVVFSMLSTFPGCSAPTCGPDAPAAPTTGDWDGTTWTVVRRVYWPAKPKKL